MPAGKIPVFIFNDQFLRLITGNRVYFTGFFMPVVMPAGNSACGYVIPQCMSSWCHNTKFVFLVNACLSKTKNSCFWQTRVWQNTILVSLRDNVFVANTTFVLFNQYVCDKTLIYCIRSNLFCPNTHISFLGTRVFVKTQRSCFAPQSY